MHTKRRDTSLEGSEESSKNPKPIENTDHVVITNAKMEINETVDNPSGLGCNTEMGDTLKDQSFAPDICTVPEEDEMTPVLIPV